MKDIRKYGMLVLALILIVSVLAGCSTESSIDSTTAKLSGDSSSTDASKSDSEPPDLKEASTNENQLGNTNGNLVNGARVAISGDWIYCSLWDGIYRMKPDGTEMEMIHSWESNTNPSALNISDGWIYFKRSSPFKIKVDGTELQQISEFKYIGSFRVIDDWMYFGCEYKMKTDGSNLQQMYDKRGASGKTVNIVDGWIYYYDSDNEGNDSIYKSKTDGTDELKIYSGRTDIMIVDGDWIYYEEYDSKDLYKMKIDGSDSQLVVQEDGILSINVDDDWIYYSGSDDAGVPSLCKIKTDGTDKQVLYADNANDICIIKGWIYYDINGGEDVNGKHVERLYRIKTDGSGRQVIE